MATGPDQKPKGPDQLAGSKPVGADAPSPVIIKKYANRRLYNTSTSGYVTLDSLAQMVRERVDFIVYDARTSEDITRSVLTQIIFDEEGKGRGLLPIDFLRHLIRLYGDSLQTFVPGYLDMSMEALSRNQEQIRRYVGETLGGKTPLEQFEVYARQNLVFFERAMRMFSPFGSGAETEARREEPGSAGALAAPASGARQSEIDNLKRQLLTMQQQIDNLAKQS